MSQRSAMVVGGGIAGLATGIALSERGWRVRVRERSPELREVGAGISLWSNALRALDTIGGGRRIGDRIRALGGIEVNAGIRHRDGRWLVRSDVDEIRERFGDVVIVHRADLLQVLVEALPAGVLEVGSTVDDGTDLAADLIVGADGIRSTVRQRWWPSAPQPRYAGYTAWRFVTKPFDRPVHEAGESWGRGTRFGLAALPDGRVYCYATANRPEGESNGPDEPGELGDSGRLDELRQTFGDWHDPIPDLLTAAIGGPVLRHDMYELPDLPSYVHGRVALVGDAAHAMTPNLGQGACQALEDVATLATLLEDQPVETALRRYDEVRRRHTQTVVRLSRQAGSIGQWSNPVAVALRDRLLPLVPSWAMTRSLARVFDANGR
jgi:2-polyprenyl-6-methoxyphenol hydroxylase-like FAD-dependent oxidoreductase